MNTSKVELLQHLRELTINNLQKAERMITMPEASLNQKPSEQSWSILECYEHLNRYSDFYIPEIKNRLSKAKHSNTNHFRSGWLGNYFAESMLPGPEMKKINTFKSMNPNGSRLTKVVLQKFIDYQNQTLELLQQANDYDLNKIKTSISISKLIKLRLGDTLRVVINHNHRHVVQAEKVQSLLKLS